MTQIRPRHLDPGISPPELKALAWRHYPEFGENPVWSLLCLEDPSLETECRISYYRNESRSNRDSILHCLREEYVSHATRKGILLWAAWYWLHLCPEGIPLVAERLVSYLKENLQTKQTLGFRRMPRELRSLHRVTGYDSLHGWKRSGLCAKESESLWWLIRLIEVAREEEAVYRLSDIYQRNENVRILSDVEAAHPCLVLQRAMLAHYLESPQEPK